MILFLNQYQAQNEMGREPDYISNSRRNKNHTCLNYISQKTCLQYQPTKQQKFSRRTKND